MKLLLIEDNRADARFIEKMLAGSRSGPFDIEWVDRLSSGLERLKSGNVDIVLLDLSLPDAQGLAVFSAVHEAYPQVPVIVLTGLDDENIANKAVQLGAQDYLLKGDVAAWLGRNIRFGLARHSSEQKIRQLNDELAQRVAELAEANTNLMAVSEDLQIARDNALEAAKAKSVFVANISHELRTTLTGIISAADLLAYGKDLDSESKYLVELLQSSASSLLSIVNDTLDLAKLEAGRLALEHIPFNILFVIQDATRAMSIEASTKGLVLRCDLDYGLPELVLGDPVRLRQILLNLIGNAVKFTNKGEVSVSVDLVSTAAELVVIEFTVSDTGIGMSSDQLQQLFKPFIQGNSTISRRYGGTGLGLSITKQLLDMMDGKLTCSSQEDVGTSFSFTVQFECAAHTRTGHQEPTPAMGMPLRGTVLLVEDNKIIADVVLRQLSSLGVQGCAVDGGRAALDRLERMEFDLILMDCQMPRMEGLETTSLICQSEKFIRKPIPIIALTATTIEDEQKFHDAGMDEFLPKPVTLRRLREVLRRWLPCCKSNLPNSSNT